MITLEEDKLNRVGLITNLFSFFENFGDQNGEGLTMLINGKYGTGKSTFLSFIEEENCKNNNYNILKYDAWENNLFENPLIPILYTLSKMESMESKIKTSIKNIIKNTPHAFVNTISGLTNVDIKAVVSNKDIFEEYNLYKSSIVKFKQVLTEFCKKKKTIFLVDELDRCLPEYQIKVLESIYHLLDIPNLIVVIAIDRNQLEYSIKNKFGNAVNIFGYLSKFIKYEINLPNHDVFEHIITLMNFNSEYNSEVKSVLSNMLASIDLSIRDCQIIISELNLVCNEVDKDGNAMNYLYWYPILVCLLLIIKKSNNNIYLKYFGSERERSRYFKNKVLLKDTDFFKFINDIRDTDIEKIFQYLLQDNYGQSFMLHFINTFINIELIDVESIASYTKINVERVTAIINDFNTKMWDFPNGINKLLVKINSFQ